MMDGLVDVYRPEVHGVYETVDYAHYWNSIELVLVAHQEVFVGQSLHILQPILLLFIDLAPPVACSLLFCWLFWPLRWAWMPSAGRRIALCHWKRLCSIFRQAPRSPLKVRISYRWDWWTCRPLSRAMKWPSSLYILDLEKLIKLYKMLQRRQSFHKREEGEYVYRDMISGWMDILDKRD